MYHENVFLLCDAIHNAVPEFPIYSCNFLSNVVCSPESENCMMGNCETCQEKMSQWFASFQGLSFNNEIFWYQWSRDGEFNEMAHTRRKGNQESLNEVKGKQKRIQKKCHVGTVAEAVNSLKEKLPEFLIHVYIKREQSSFFQYKLMSIPPQSAVIQIDFSENYALQHQGEIQSAHWNQSQLTLFTVCVWMRKETRRVVVVSDGLDHDKTSVLCFINHLLGDLKKHSINQIDIISDGPSSQFKNQYVLNCLPVLLERHDLARLHWHFFATSHGKGAVDGIGGVVKRSVWMKTLSGLVVVSSLEDFCQSAKKREEKIEIISFSAQEIQESAIEMGVKDIFSCSTPVFGINKTFCCISR